MNYRISCPVLEPNHILEPLLPYYSVYCNSNPPISFLEAMQDIMLEVRSAITEKNYLRILEQIINSCYTAGVTWNLQKSDSVPSKAISSNLSESEISSLLLYSAESKTDISFSTFLNEALSQPDRSKIVPYSKLLYLLMKSLRKCPLFEGPTVFHGVKHNFSSTCSVGSTFIAHQFISCTNNMETLLLDDALGTSGSRTVFEIELKTDIGRIISQYTWKACHSISEEIEIILPPETQFEIIECNMFDDDFAIIRIREIFDLTNLKYSLHNDDLPVLLHHYDKIPQKIFFDGSSFIENLYIRCRNYDKIAFQELIQLADSHNHLAEGCLSRLYFLGTDFIKPNRLKSDMYAARCLLWAQQYSAVGHPSAQMILGNCYYDGTAIAKDVDRAAQLYLSSAYQGNAMAQTAIAWCYYKGDGVPKNDNEELRWHRAAAAQGYSIAQTNVGYCCQNGIGTPKNLVRI